MTHHERYKATHQAAEARRKAKNARTAAEIDALYNEFIAKIKGGE